MAVRAIRTTDATVKQQQLLNAFWEARGVLDPAQRKRLVDAADELDSGEPGAVGLTCTQLARSCVEAHAAATLQPAITATPPAEARHPSTPLYPISSSNTS
ncbi:hypothetical protein TSOC_001090 [Tetrabaena socialis]|uniref:Uncharacterized protein n=1 Tax=Tetrabaena socialis TaxID=47790 RepID=A0A2J8AHN5_9CHLO|nr:hypothetical protein TSOC_001090 [Tetrabaena socialis]|eukprot:PNH12028.1 hypothetical protein TSOC_001090 [Tetrabaena socialis]